MQNEHRAYHLKVNLNSVHLLNFFCEIKGELVDATEVREAILAGENGLSLNSAAKTSEESADFLSIFGYF